MYVAACKGKSIIVAVVFIALLALMLMIPGGKVYASGSWTDTGGGVKGHGVQDFAYDGDRNVLYAATYDNGVWRCDNPNTSPAWTNMGGGLSGYRVDSLLFDDNRNVLYAGTTGHGVWRCDNPDTSPSWTDTGGGLSGYTVGSLAYDSGRNILYAGAYNYGLWRCTNPHSTPSWSSTGSLSILTELEYDEVNNILYAGTPGSVLRFENPDTSYSKTSITGPLSGCMVGGLVYDSSRNLLYAGGYNSFDDTGYGVWRCTDPDSTFAWENISGEISGAKVYSMTRDVVDNLLYVGSSDEGVWRCIDPGSSPIWEYIGEGLENTTFALAYDGVHNLVYAGPWKQSVWRYNASYTFYFAEGYTGEGFEEWLCLMNPSTTATTAQVTYMFADGSTQIQDVPIGPTTRATVDVNEAVGPDKNVSIMVQSEQAIVAERPMYFEYKGKWPGGHDVVGASSLDVYFYFAEGYTGEGFEEWLCLMNPNEESIEVQVKYMFADSDPQEQNFSMGPTSRKTVNVNDAVGPDKNVSIEVYASNNRFMAERPIYFNYKGAWSGGHNVVGAAQRESTYFFAEGYTGEGFEEWLCLMYPGFSFDPGNVLITYMFSDGTTQTQEVVIEPTSRETIFVNDIVGPDKNVSIKVEADENIVVERPIYFNYKGAWSGGHDVVGYSP